MYNTKVVCTYNTSEVFLETDNISDEEKDFVRNAIYRQELLDILELEDYDESKLDDAFCKLHEKVKACNDLLECMHEISRKYNIQSDIIGLMMMYSYDSMFLTHICVSEFIEKGKIEKSSILKLKAFLF